MNIKGLTTMAQLEEFLAGTQPGDRLTTDAEFRLIYGLENTAPNLKLMAKIDKLPPYPADCVNNPAVKFCRSKKYRNYSGGTKENMIAIESTINTSF